MVVEVELSHLSGDPKTYVFIDKTDDVLDFLQEVYYEWMFDGEEDLDEDQTWSERDQVLLELVYIINPEQMVDYAEQRGVRLTYTVLSLNTWYVAQDLM